MFGFSVILENLEFFCTCYRQKMSLPVPFYEFARTFLPVCYVQTTRKVPPFSTKNKGKNGAFQSFSPLFTRAFSSLQEITLWKQADYPNAPIFANLETNPTSLLFRAALQRYFVGIIQTQYHFVFYDCSVYILSSSWKLMNLFIRLIRFLDYLCINYEQTEDFISIDSGFRQYDGTDGRTRYFQHRQHGGGAALAPEYPV